MFVKFINHDQAAGCKHRPRLILELRQLVKNILQPLKNEHRHRRLQIEFISHQSTMT